MSPDSAHEASQGAEGARGSEHERIALSEELIDVSVVLPCLNEEQTVASCVRKARGWFAAAGLRGEVLVVDNGSTDRSREEALAAGARVVDEAQRGYGSAHRRGFAEARGKVIIMADADETYDLSNLSSLVGPFERRL